jgi:Domain of unknown function (DUF4149)
MLLALVVWVGGVLFFSAVQAPATSHVLGTSNPAFGEIINRSLSILHYFGLASGILFLFASLAAQALSPNYDYGRPQQRPSTARLLVLVMLVLTAFSQFWISRRMHAIRTAHPGYEHLSFDDPARMQFLRLHKYSVATEGTVLLLGLGAVALTARRMY